MTARKGRSTSIDLIVSRNVRSRRLAKGLTQEHVAKELGVSFQQIQKYENGTNRIASGRLFQIAKLLGVPVQKLFEGCDPK